MDDGEVTAPDDPPSRPLAPPQATSFQPPPMPIDLPAPTIVATAPAAVPNNRRFPWVTVIIGVVALAAILALSMLFLSASGDKDDAQQALAETQADLKSTEVDLAESQAALAEAQSDLSDTTAELADTESARAEAEAARDEHQQEIETYDAATIDFLTA